MDTVGPSARHQLWYRFKNTIDRRLGVGFARSEVSYFFSFLFLRLEKTAVATTQEHSTAQHVEKVSNVCGNYSLAH